MAQEITFKIIGGPGKMDLMLSLFDGKIVTFTLQSGSSVQCKILSIEQEDGSLESWNIKGYVAGYNERFTGYYKTRGNEGWFIF